MCKCLTPDHEVFHGLHQAALDVPSGGGLDSSVDQTLAPSHGVEEQLLCAHTALQEEVHANSRLPLAPSHGFCLSAA